MKINNIKNWLVYNTSEATYEWSTWYVLLFCLLQLDGHSVVEFSTWYQPDCCHSTEYCLHHVLWEQEIFCFTIFSVGVSVNTGIIAFTSVYDLLKPDVNQLQSLSFILMI